MAASGDGVHLVPQPGLARGEDLLMNKARVWCVRLPALWP